MGIINHCTELHHWGPKELFPETFEFWPKSYLCDDHHREWHDTITNPFTHLIKQQEKNGNGQPNAKVGNVLS
jgi:hypothetical protein